MKKDKTMLIQLSSRKEAIADGALIDVTATAKEAGIRHPTAVTREVWERFVKVPQGAFGQDEAGRLWDILWMLQNAARKSAPKETSLDFTLWVHDGEEMQYVGLKAICGPGDDLEPVITVMLPGVA
jgi:hypothetical protein